MIGKIKEQVSQHKLPFLLAFVAVATIVGPLAPIFNTNVYYAAMGLFVLCSLGRGRFTINFTYILLILGAVASLTFNNIPPVFEAWSRLVFFVLMSIPISPMIENNLLRTNRLKALNFMLWFSVAVALASFACYLLGINYMVNFVTGDNAVNNAGWFGGITVHSMLMGPVSALGATFMTWYATGHVFKISRNRIIAYVCIFICVASAMLSASRGSTVAAIVGCGVVYLFRKGKSGPKMAGALISFLFIVLIAQPLLKPFSDMVMQKQYENIELGGTFSSRSNKWENRMDEFASSPIIGSGFCTVSIDSHDFTYGGIVEPGTSWLSVLSMLGLVGAVCIWKIVFDPAWKLCKTMNRTDVLFMGIFCVFLLHMATEGYIFAGGNFMFFYFWLFVGAMHAYRKTSNYTFF